MDFALFLMACGNNSQRPPHPAPYGAGGGCDERVYFGEEGVGGGVGGLWPRSVDKIK